MEVVDENGRLFGRVNVIDALVVLVALSLVGAGSSLLLAPADEPAPEPGAVRYATVSYAVPLDSDGADLSNGSTLRSPRGGESFAVADTYYSFTPNGDAHVVARVAYREPLTVDGQRTYGGDRAVLTTNGYRMAVNVTDINRTSRDLRRSRTSVVLETNETAVARAVEPGDTATINGRTVATVSSVQRDRAPSGTDRVFVGVELVTLETEGGLPVFNGDTLRIGTPVTVVTDTVVVPGRVYRIGTANASEADV